MSEEFSKALDMVADWAKNYRDEVASYPVMSQQGFGALLNALPSMAPEQAESFESIFEDFKTLIVPGITHWQHPKFFGYFPSNSSAPSVLAEMLISTMGIQGMSWITSPAATELEMRMLEWMRDLFGLSKDFVGSIQDSASSSTMTAMIVARELATDYCTNRDGVGSQRLVAYCSSEAHSSIEKAAKIVGVGSANLRKIPVDEHLAMRVDLLEDAIAQDKAKGYIPFFVVGAFGTTGTTAVDDLAAIARIAKAQHLWFHVDAAYAGSALALPEMRSLAKGIDDADSVVVNPHKWLLTTFDCSTFFIKHKDALIRSFELLPEYLKTPEGDAVVNYRDWGPGLGRRFRSLKLWFVMRWYGAEGIRSILRRHVDVATKFENLVANDERFELMTPRLFNLVCFRLKGDNDLNHRILNEINRSGKMFLSHTKVGDKVCWRMVFGQTDVNEEHMRQAWTDILGFLES